MDFFEVINKRYSYRGEFLDKSVPKEDLEKILTAGVKAPTAMNVQTTYFVAVTNKDKIKQIGELMPKNGTATAGAIIIALTENVVTKCGLAFEIENYSAAIENVLLAVTALGYATVWTDGMSRSPQVNDKVREILNIPNNKVIRAILPVGVPKEEGEQAPKEGIDKMVTFVD